MRTQRTKSSIQEQDDYIKFLKHHKNEPYWKTILNTENVQLENKIEQVKTDITKNKFEMKQLLKQNLPDYLYSQNQLKQLKSELQTLKNTSTVKYQNIREHFESLKQNRKKQEEQQKLQENNEPKEEKLRQQIQSHCPSQIYKQLINEWNEYINIFDIESILASAIKLELYDLVCKLLIWLEKLTHQNEQTSQQELPTQEQQSNIKQYFLKIMNKYRKIICEVCFMAYKKSNKQEIRMFFKKFGQNVLQQDHDWFFRDLFNAHFNRTLKLRVDKLTTTPGNHQYVAQILQIYAKSIHKSYFYVTELAEELQKPINELPFQETLNKISYSLLHLVNRKVIGDQAYLEIFMQLPYIHEPLATLIKEKVNIYHIKDLHEEQLERYLNFSTIQQQLHSLQELFTEENYEYNNNLERYLENKEISVFATLSNMLQYYYYVLNYNDNGDTSCFILDFLEKVKTIVHKLSTQWNIVFSHQLFNKIIDSLPEIVLKLNLNLNKQQ